MRGLSLCDGIGAALVAAPWVEWVAVSEIEPFPNAVHAHHFPDIPNWGDMTRFQEWPDEPVDLVVGGTPCQSFSVAGLRQGLADPRGNLSLVFLGVVAKYRPRWIMYENVPGILSDKGNFFGQFTAALADLGYGWAYRVLDAKHFGVPQRRRRVFLVGHLGDWTRAAEVLFEREGEGGHPPAGAEAREEAAPDAAGRAVGIDEECNATIDGFGPLLAMVGSEGDPMFTLSTKEHAVAYRKSRRAQSAEDCETWVDDGVANTLNQFDTGERDTHAVIAFNHQAAQNFIASPDATNPLRANQTEAVCIPINTENMHPASTSRGLTVGDNGDPQFSITKAHSHAVAHGQQSQMQVRRLTPTECERLQGFPDGYTRIPIKVLKHEPKTITKRKCGGERPTHFAKHPDQYGRNEDGTWTRYASDGPRYKALGNSWAVPCAKWVMDRIRMVDENGGTEDASR